MQRSQFLRGAASASLPLVGLAGCARNLSLPSTGASAATSASRWIAEGSIAAADCPLGAVFTQSLKTVKNYPDASVLSLLRKTAALKHPSPAQVLVGTELLGAYLALPTLPRPIPPAPALKFPADHGEHFDMGIEWRYVTLSLPLQGGGLVSVVMAFFRRALLGPTDMPSLKTMEKQLFSTSIGVTVQMPGAPGVHYAWPITAFAGCDVTLTSSPFKMVLGKNSIEGTADVFPMRLHLEDEGDWSVGRPPMSIDVDCAATNPFFLQGVNGYVGPSVEPGKNPDIGWYYYSWPQQKTTGSVTVDGATYKVVNGLAWMDHQWGGAAKVTSGSPTSWGGWSWFELQFDQGYSLTCTSLHGPVPSGKLPLHNAGFGTFVDKNQGSLISMLMQVGKYSQSPFTTARYPSGWTLEVAGFDAARNNDLINLTVKPVAKVEPQALWMNGIVEYSEASCSVTASGTIGGSSVQLSGVGYCEGVGFENPKYRVARDVAFLQSSLT